MEIDVNGLKKLTKLTILDLGNNNIGTVPPELGLLTSIRSLTLGNYNLSKYLSAWSKTHRIDLQMETPSECQDLKFWWKALNQWWHTLGIVFQGIMKETLFKIKAWFSVGTKMDAVKERLLRKYTYIFHASYCKSFML